MGGGDLKGHRELQKLNTQLAEQKKSMVDQVDLLKERYESLEKRRKQEGEGYQADIHLLKQKLKHVEHQLIRAAVNRTKGNFRTKVKECEKNSKKIPKKKKKKKKKK